MWTSASNTSFRNSTDSRIAIGKPSTGRMEEFAQGPDKHASSDFALSAIFVLCKRRYLTHHW